MQVLESVSWSFRNDFKEDWECRGGRNVTWYVGLHVESGINRSFIRIYPWKVYFLVNPEVFPINLVNHRLITHQVAAEVQRLELPRTNPAS